MVRRPLTVVVAYLLVFAVGHVYGPGALAQGISCADAVISAQGSCSDEAGIAGASGGDAGRGDWAGLGYDIGENLTAGIGLSGVPGDGASGALGYSVAPYGIYRFNDTFSIDLKARFTSLFDQGAVGEALSTKALLGQGSESDRFYGALNLSGGWLMDAWSLGANIGTLYALDSANDMAERDTLGLNPQATGGGRVNVSGRLSYQFDSALEPYVSALLEYGYSDDAGTYAYDDRVGLVLGLGLNIFTGANFTANVESSTSRLRADSEDYSLNAKIRLEF